MAGVRPEASSPTYVSVLTSPRSAFRNAMAAAVADRLCSALVADRRVVATVLELADHEKVKPAIQLSGMVLNLSVYPSATLLDILPAGTGLLDIRFRDGQTSGFMLQGLAGMPWYLFGAKAVWEHPAVVGLEVVYTLLGETGSRSLGAWWGRANAKSVKPATRELMAGCYLPLDAFVAHLAVNQTPDSYPRLSEPDLCKAPGGAFEALTDRAVYWCRHAWLTFRNLGQPRREIQWNVGIGTASANAPAGPLEPKWANARPNGSYADPFLLNHGGAWHVFFEELDFRNNRGFISVAPLTPDGGIDIERRTTALETQAHLSFPFVFEHEGDVFMLPEQASTRQLLLYRATHYPTRWEVAATVLDDVEAADPVLLLHQGVWYLFYSDARAGNYDNNLQLFVADSPLGPFTRHPCSPLRLSLDGSRMAGAILREGDALYRLGQDCRKVYGGGVVLFFIEELSPTTYREVRLREVGPLAQGGFDQAYHTYVRVGNQVVFDGARIVDLDT